MKCLRCLKSCDPYGQIQSDNGNSFICVGANDGYDRVVEQDEYTLCWKNKYVDERSHWDKRDLTDTAAVLHEMKKNTDNWREGSTHYISENRIWQHAQQLREGKND